MRLTKLIREQIINNSLVQSGIIKREKKLSESIAKLAEDCRIFAFGGETDYAKMIVQSDYIKEELKLLPSQADFSSFYLSTSYYISVSFGGMSVYLQYAGSFRDTRFRVIKRDDKPTYITGVSDVLGVNKISPRDKLLLTASNGLSRRFERIHNNMEQLKKERGELIAKLQGALSTFTTTNALLKDWPDMKPLIPLPVEKSVKHLPMVQVKELNKLIGLPVK